MIHNFETLVVLLICKSQVSDCKENKINDFQLNEWLRGFTDGEGCFQIKIVNNRPFTISFIFKIKLHKDDRPLLEYLSTKINIGKVYPKDIDNKDISSTWEVRKKADIIKLIRIFDKHPLNTTKYLDYLLWRKAFFYIKRVKN